MARSLLLGLVVLGILPWLAGFAAYNTALLLLFHERLSPGDARAVVFWSVVAYVMAIPVFWPVMAVVEEKIGGRGRTLWFPVAGAVAGVVPLGLIAFVWGSRPASVFAPELVLFAALFCIAGAVFGFGYARVFAS